MQNVTYKTKKQNKKKTQTYFWWFMGPSNNIIIKHLAGFNPPMLFACPTLGYISWRGSATVLSLLCVAWVAPGVDSVGVVG